MPENMPEIAPEPLGPYPCTEEEIAAKEATDRALDKVFDKFRCRHVFTGGRRCGSPALRREEFCYHHHASRKPIRHEHSVRMYREALGFDLPEIDDRAGVTLALFEVLRRIAGENLNLRRAGLLLYGLQIAAINLPPHPPANPAEPIVPLEQVETHPIFGPVAPVAPMVQT